MSYVRVWPDYVLRTFVVRNKFFSRGWGPPDLLRRLWDFQELVKDEPAFEKKVYGVLEDISHDIKFKELKDSNGSAKVFAGEFNSPLNHFIPGALPEKCERVRFELILPNHWRGQKPVCLHFPSTGDHYLAIRRNRIALPLAKDYGIGSITLQNPFYGCRKPGDQSGSAANHVSDILVMGGGLLLESIILMLWCKRKGFGPLGISGVSLGASMASFVQSGWFEPLAVVPCLTWTSAAPCWTEGVLSTAVDWKTLERQLNDEPGYQNLLRDDVDFRTQLLTHYTNPQYLTEMRKQEGKVEEGFLETVSSSLSAISQKIGIETGTYNSISRQLESISSSVSNSMKGVNNILPVRINDGNNSKPSPETVDYMLTLFDQHTHLSYLKPPRDGSKTMFVTAKHDGYFPTECCTQAPNDVWPDVTMREIDSCHVGGIMWNQGDFNKAIVDTFHMMGCQF